MKKAYQKRLDKIFRQSPDKTCGVDEDTNNDDIPEIEELDQILELPPPIREISFVKAVCKTYKRCRKSKNDSTKPEPSSEPQKSSASDPSSLAEWQESDSKSQTYNSRN